MTAAIPRADILNLEDYNMHRAHRYIASLFLTAAIAAPVAIMAVPAPQEVKVQLRFYDKHHKDYHNWDDNENRNWERYNSENHRKSREFSKEHQREQQKYWNWRHSHPDNH
jgi:hypothetical protein